MSRLWKIVLVVLGMGIVVLGMVAAVWVLDVAEPMPEALAALASDGEVTVTQDPWWIFAPTEGETSQGFIFYPGGKVDPRAYAPPARAIAAAGYTVVIVPMPVNLAVLAPDRADAVIDAFPASMQWTIGGHSLGGSMAARYAQRRPDAVDGLVLWASFPTDASTLSERNDLAAASIYGTLDGLVTAADIEASRSLLPSTTTWTAIEGGNHAQFGWYGEQGGDNPATISRSVQQQATVDATIALIQQLSP